MSLREHGVAFDTELIDLQDKPANFTALYAGACADPRSRAKVPLLELGADGPVLIESLVICDFLDDAADADGRPDPAERANARLYANLFQSAISYVPILKAEAGSDDEAAAIASLREGMAAMDAYLKAHGEAGGPYLLGSRWSYAESTTAPFAARFATVLPALRPDLDPYAMMADDGLSALSAWMEAVVSRPSCVETLPAADVLVGNYRKLLERIKAAPA